MSGPVRVELVRTRGEREEFLRVPWRIYQGDSRWVPPLLFEQRQLTDPRRGPFFKHSTGEFWVARRDGEAVGRIAAFKNQPHLNAHRDGTGFFGFFESPDDPVVARALFAAAEDWLRAQGLRASRGPANFTIYDEAGVMLDGFEHTPMTGMTYMPPYYRALVEGAGYGRVKDVYVYRVTPATVRRDRIDRLAAAAERVGGARVRPLDMKNLRRESEFLATVYAEAWGDNWGWVPFSAQEFYEAYEHYRFFIRPELVLLAEIDGEPAGYSVTMPDMNQVLAKMNGRLLPTGVFHLLFGRSGITQFRVLMTGVRPKFRRAGLPMIFMQRCLAELIRIGVTEMEFSWILEENREVIALLERIGATRIQTLRFYDKVLA